jgi:Domain of unknown function (DUF4249)
MRFKIHPYWLFFLIPFLCGACKKTYAPPETNANHLFLSVDGLINVGTNVVSRFQLTRSQNLSDTLPATPVLGARVSVQASTGSEYVLTDSGSTGVYFSGPLTLDSALQYKLVITTPDGGSYASDPVTPKLTPPIDSLQWTLGFDGAANTDAVNIYLNTHDPSNQARFYRWDYTETWEYGSVYQSIWLVENKIITRAASYLQHNWYCWSNGLSSNILLGSSAGLNADVIQRAPIARYYKNDPRLDIELSVLVRQYALQSQAYDYWMLVQQVSQSLGGLFDAQPAQFIGNIHNLNTPGEPVYGYVSAASVQEKRIFITNVIDVPGWKSPSPLSCPMLINPPQMGLYDYTGTDPLITILGFDMDNPTNQILTPTACVDCAFQGGSPIKPSFWQ